MAKLTKIEVESLYKNITQQLVEGKRTDVILKDIMLLYSLNLQSARLHISNVYKLMKENDNKELEELLCRYEEMYYDIYTKSYQKGNYSLCQKILDSLTKLKTGIGDKSVKPNMNDIEIEL